MVRCMVVVAAGERRVRGRALGRAAHRITVMVAGDPEEIEAYRAVVDGFDEAQDEVDAELIPSPSGTTDPAALHVDRRRTAARPLPDELPVLRSVRRPGRARARRAVPQDSDAFSEGDFFDTAMTPFRWDGEQMCLPQNVSSLVVYYNADLFQDAGVALPQDGWSWDDMVRRRGEAHPRRRRRRGGRRLRPRRGPGDHPRRARSSGPTGDGSSTTRRRRRGSPGRGRRRRARAVLRPPDRPRRHPDGRGGRGGGLREPVPERPSRDADGVAARGADAPDDHGLRVGRGRHPRRSARRRPSCTPMPTA